MPQGLTTVATVIDALIGLITGLDAVQANGNTPAVPVYDGAPGGAGTPPTFIAILGQGPSDAPNARETWKGLGTRTRTEDYGIKGEIVCMVGGSDNLAQFGPSGSNAQQTARNAATSLLQAIEAALLSDPDLSDQNDGNQLVLWAYLTSSRLSQPGPTDPDLSKGRWAQYDFTISVHNQLTYVPD